MAAGHYQLAYPQLMKKETIPMPLPNDWITRIKTNAIDQQSPRRFADGTWFVFGCHQIQIEQLIGKGVFGEVYSVKTNAIQKLCLKVQEYNLITVDQINLEMTVMYQIKQSPGASKWLMTDVLAFSLTGLHCFAMEEMGFSLLNLLNQKTGPFDLEMIRGISTGMLMGLAHLHYLGYTHSDIKPSNILLNRTAIGSTFAKIADFGNVNITREMSKLRYKNCVQATWYRPPEVYLGMQQDNKTDIWAAGCVLAEMYTGRALFPTPEQLHQLSRMHFWLTGLPTNAETEGRFFFSYYKVDEMTGIRRPLTDIELMGYEMRLESYQQRPYTQMEQLLSLGRNARARGLTVEDYFILDLLKNMLQADGVSRSEARDLLQTPFFTNPR